MECLVFENVYRKFGLFSIDKNQWEWGFLILKFKFLPLALKNETDFPLAFFVDRNSLTFAERIKLPIIWAQVDGQKSIKFILLLDLVRSD